MRVGKPSPAHNDNEVRFALAATFLAYGLTELASGYGFIAVFVPGKSRFALRRSGYDQHEVPRRLGDKDGPTRTATNTTRRNRPHDPDTRPR